MNIALWTLQILFGVLFFVHGIALMVQPVAMRDVLEALPYPSGFLVFIGVCEMLGGLGLILPMWTGIAKWPTPLAGAGLAIIMAGAAWPHLTAQEGVQTGFTLVITLLLAFVTYARWSLFARPS